MVFLRKFPSIVYLPSLLNHGLKVQALLGAPESIDKFNFHLNVQ